jgi:uncharacterized membrane protein
MSDLIAIAYPDQATVERARDHISKGVTDGVIDVEDVVVLVRDDDGSVDVRQGSSGTAAAAAGGAMWGGLIGLIFFAPLFGMAAGALAAGAAWKSNFGDAGVAEGFVNELRDKLTPGGGALILLVRDMEIEQVLARIEEHGHVIHTSLSDDVEAQLEAAMTAAGRTQQ